MPDQTSELDKFGNAEETIRLSKFHFTQTDWSVTVEDLTPGKDLDVSIADRDTPRADSIVLKNGDHVPLDEAVALYTTIDRLFRRNRDSAEIHALRTLSASLTAVDPVGDLLVADPVALATLREMGVILPDNTIEPVQRSLVASCFSDLDPDVVELPRPHRNRPADRVAWDAEKLRQVKAVIGLGRGDAAAGPVR